jgi:hypothetical protein
LCFFIAGCGSGANDTVKATTPPPVAQLDSDYIDRGDGTLYQPSKKLTWLKDANCYGTLTWNEAVIKVNDLSSGKCGLSDGSKAGDWRLPYSGELQNDYFYLRSFGFTNIGTTFYWVKDTPLYDDGTAQGVKLGDYAHYTMSKSDPNLIWLVR